MLIVAIKGGVVRGGEVIIRFILKKNLVFPSYFSL
jgi:hypothetical protein